MSAIASMWRGDNDFDFVGRFRIGVVLSMVLVLASIGSLFVRHLNLGIDFEGGVVWQVEAPDVSVARARDALAPVGLADAKIQILGADTLRVQSPPQDPASVTKVEEALAELSGSTVEDIAFSEVGPSWGDTITQKAVRALVFFLVAITLYIAFRFEWRMAVAALVAVFHDVLVSVGVYSIFQFEVTPATVIAFLTILGYSLYDTIVVFDKVRENAVIMGSSSRATYGDVLNVSMNEVIMRTVNTTLTSVLPVVSMLVVGSLILGVVTLQDFALALLIGMMSGTYSSVFTASPLLLALKRREPRYAQREVAAASVAADATTPRARATAGTAIKPRARKKRRR